MHNVNNAMRFFFLVIGSVVLLGIWLTGYEKVHWVSYLPAVFFYFAAITGICPGLMISGNLFSEKKAAKSKKRR